MPLLTELGIFLLGGFLQRYRAYGAKKKSRPGFPQRLWYYSRNLFYCTTARKIVSILRTDPNGAYLRAFFDGFCDCLRLRSTIISWRGLVSKRKFLGRRFTARGSERSGRWGSRSLTML